MESAIYLIAFRQLVVATWITYLLPKRLAARFPDHLVILMMDGNLLSPESLSHLIYWGVL